MMMKNNREYVLNTWIFIMNAFVAALLIITKILANLFSINDLFTICDALGLFHFYVLLQSDIHQYLITAYDTLRPVASLLFFMTVIQMISILRKIILIRKNIQEKKGESEHNEDNNYIN